MASPTSFPSLHNELIRGTLTTNAFFQQLQQAKLRCLRACKASTPSFSPRENLLFQGAFPLSKLDPS